MKKNMDVLENVIKNVRESGLGEKPDTPGVNSTYFISSNDNNFKLYKCS